MSLAASGSSPPTEQVIYYVHLLCTVCFWAALFGVRSQLFTRLLDSFWFNHCEHTRQLGLIVSFHYLYDVCFFFFFMVTACWDKVVNCFPISYPQIKWNLLNILPRSCLFFFSLFIQSLFSVVPQKSQPQWGGNLTVSKDTNYSESSPSVCITHCAFFLFYASLFYVRQFCTGHLLSLCQPVDVATYIHVSSKPSNLHWFLSMLKH